MGFSAPQGEARGDRKARFMEPLNKKRIFFKKKISKLAFSRPENTLAFPWLSLLRISISGFNHKSPGTNLHFSSFSAANFSSPLLLLLFRPFLWPFGCRLAAVLASSPLPFLVQPCLLAMVVFSATFLSLSSPPLLSGAVVGNGLHLLFFFFPCALGRGRPDLKPSTPFFLGGGGFSMLAAVYFSDLFLGIVDDIVPFGCGPHLFMDYLENCISP
ncbi:hypothetical protein Cgig2_023948 [Carnegiea gigantea]|uniref:Uncharacterized protein n=1 Tax=Carnegiea gigantea TaxID=171969 RepID=A0A9Q1KB92_9CARY|nr:hypothetical protein Cgig2_023948 [Carnegiea gigantea]